MRNAGPEPATLPLPLPLPLPKGVPMLELPPDIFAALRVADPEDIPGQAASAWALLTPFHEKVGFAAPRIDRDLAYGPHERNRLDVHADDEAGEPAPVVLFVHGGGFVAGDKQVPGTPMYDHVGAWAVRNRWPAGAQDVAAAVAWTRENIAAYGGDPERIIVAGHSAGAVHVASFLAGQGGGTLDGVAGGALLSGIYDLDRRTAADWRTPTTATSPPRGHRRCPACWSARCRCCSAWRNETPAVSTGRRPAWSPRGRPGTVPSPT
jgi:acetyl esterase/lipase